MWLCHEIVEPTISFFSTMISTCSFPKANWWVRFYNVNYITFELKKYFSDTKYDDQLHLFLTLPFVSCNCLTTIETAREWKHSCPESSNQVFTHHFPLHASDIFRLMMTSSSNRNHRTNHILYKYISLTSTPCYFPRIDGQLVKLQLWKGGNWRTAGCEDTHGSIYGACASLYQHHPFPAVPLLPKYNFSIIQKADSKTGLTCVTLIMTIAPLMYSWGFKKCHDCRVYTKKDWCYML